MIMLACYLTQLPPISTHHSPPCSADEVVVSADGADLPAVAARLGHASPTTTLRVYAHAVAAGDARAAELTGSRLPPPRNS